MEQFSYCLCALKQITEVAWEQLRCTHANEGVPVKWVWELQLSYLVIFRSDWTVQMNCAIMAIRLHGDLRLDFKLLKNFQFAIDKK